MAYHAAMTPFHTAGTQYDAGRLIALWVSAFEILAHGGPGARADKVAVLKVLSPPTPTHLPTIGATIYEQLNLARNHFLHGDITDKYNAERLTHFGAVLYRLMLTEFLRLHRTLRIVPGRGTKTWATRQGKEMALQRDFEDYQRRYEEALDTFQKPRRHGVE